MRVCIVYDHVYPATIGGGEKWLHDLAVRVAAEGHEVTYVTMRHWRDMPPQIPGVEVLALTDAGTFRDEDRRKVGAPLRFGVAVSRHLWSEGARYDIVHCSAFPYFPLLGAALARRRHSYGLVADWFEAWTREYWVRYTGRLSGTIGWLVQRRCLRVRGVQLCISEHTARRMQEEGVRQPPVVLPGLYEGPAAATLTTGVEPVVVAAARHIPEKRLPLLVEGFAYARRRRSDLRLEIFGDGPDRPNIERAVERLDLATAVSVRGRRPRDEVEAAFARAACLASTSEREGYGLVVVEAAARGTPSIVIAGPENASTDLVYDGINGVIVDRPTADAIGEAILRVVEEGDALRRTTAEWFEANADTLRLDRSLDTILEIYERTAPG